MTEEERLRLRYGASMEELCRRLLEPLGERARSAVEGAALARLRGELRRRRMKNDLLLAAAETAGELLGLEPTRRYTMEEFNAALGERIQVERGKNGKRDLTPDTLPREGAGLGEALAALGKELALLTVMENLAQLLEGGDPLLRPEFLAIALPRELLASLYLLIL